MEGYETIAGLEQAVDTYESMRSDIGVRLERLLEIFSQDEIDAVVYDDALSELNDILNDHYPERHV